MFYRLLFFFAPGPFAFAANLALALEVGTAPAQPPLPQGVSETLRAALRQSQCPLIFEQWLISKNLLKVRQVGLLCNKEDQVDDKIIISG